MIVLMDAATQKVLYTFYIREPGRIRVAAENRVYPSFIDWEVRDDGNSWFAYGVSGGSRRMSADKVAPLAPALQYITTFTKPYQVAKNLDPDGRYLDIFIECLPLLFDRHVYCMVIPSVDKEDILAGVKQVMEADWEKERRLA